MSRQFIKDIKPGQRIEGEVFLIHSKDLRTTTQGNLYIHAVLMDRTGQMVARQWQATEDMYAQMGEQGFMRFKGRVENYKGNLQFIIDAMQPAEPGSFDVTDFLPATTKDIEAMWKRVLDILRGIEHEPLKALLREFVGDEALMRDFKKAPAAMTMHHAYLGGLLEHTLQVLEVAMKVIPLYPDLNLDLVLAGVFLHDLGKARELTFESAIGYSDEGQLVGHIAKAVVWIEQKADIVAQKSGKPFPKDLLNVLQHIVLSHHGQYLFGSPKLPAVPEAIAIHYLDNLDAKVHMFLAEIANDSDPHSHWTNYNRALETKVFKPDVMGTRKNSE